MTKPRAFDGDFSAEMLTHFTRAASESRAIDNLLAILREGRIRASARMIRGATPAVCLFDVPLPELKTPLARRNRRRYQPFGVAVERRYAFKAGARPVIYMPWREARRALQPADHWRVVSIDLDRAPAIDWSFEREWRLAGDLCLDPRCTVALVEKWRDAEEIYHSFNGAPPCAGVIPLAEIFGTS